MNGEPVEILVNGQALRTQAGIPLGAALLSAGHLMLRRSPAQKTPRGLFCGMGVCFECLVSIDGTPDRRACLTKVRAGMVVEFPA